MIESVERFGQRLEPPPFVQRKVAAQPKTHAKEVRALTGVAFNEVSVDHRAGRRSLHGGGAGGEVERESRVVLQKAAQLVAMAQVLPNPAGGA